MIFISFAIVVTGIILAAAMALLGKTYDPMLYVTSTVGDRVLIQGFGWPPRKSIRLSVWMEPILEGGQVYHGAPRVLGNVRADVGGNFTYEMTMPPRVHAPKPAGYPDVFFVAFNSSKGIVREAKLHGGSDYWFA